MAGLTSATPAPTQNFFENLFGGGQGPASPAQTPRSTPRDAEPRPRREASAKAARAKRRAETHARKPAAKAEPSSAAKPPPEPPEPPPPPYDAEVQRLAEVLGGLSFLRDLCGEGDGGDWRDKMAQLRDADAPSGARRLRLTAAFNRGFHGYELTYRVCTPNARLVIARYLDEAESLSREVASRYGNP
jgi:uncharacterized protein (TIGR02301 family)